MKIGNKPISLTGTSLGKGRNSAFTLVELIIVITILAILATIGFMSYQSYTSDARDANRITSIDEISKGLSIYEIKNTKYPEPDSPSTLTGGNTTILQGTLGKTVGTTIKLTSEVKDPKTNNYYVYSTSNNGKYYQLGADLENTTAYRGIVETTYAEGTKALVKGNYSFDPSLPSLIIVSGSVNSASGIFDPNVCFVVNNGTNLVSSNSTNCTQKYKMSLKDYDSSLVGYWDMESKTTDGKLMDLSGNGNDGVFSGTILPSSTGGFLGRGYYFNKTSIIYTNSPIKYNNSKNVTISMDLDLLNNGYNYSLILESSNNSNTNTGTYYLSDFYTSNAYCLSYGLGKTISNMTLFLSGVDSRRSGLCPNNDTFSGRKNITYIFNIKDNTIKYFINGVLQEYSIFNIKDELGDGNDNYFYDNVLYIGNRYLSGKGAYGIIDDVKIYNRALSDQEIVQQARIAGF